MDRWLFAVYCRLPTAYWFSRPAFAFINRKEQSHVMQRRPKGEERGDSDKIFDKAELPALIIRTSTMDWKYKHFHQERVFPAERVVVTEAARAFMGESLGWEITDTPDRFTAQGYSFTHRAIAHLQFQTVAGEASSDSRTRVAVELLVERAGWRGYMLFDVGGYYNIQIRKWLDGIQWSLHQKLTGTRDESQNPLVLAENKPAAYIFNGCLVFIVVMFALYFLVTFICAVVGLITGNLYLLGRGGTLAVHGALARIVSALILMFGAFIAWRIKRKA
jgi:hypothetical protein